MNFDIFSIRLLCKCSHRWVHNVNADNQREPYRCPACKSNDSIKLDASDVYFGFEKPKPVEDVTVVVRFGLGGIGAYSIVLINRSGGAMIKCIAADIVSRRAAFDYAREAAKEYSCDLVDETSVPHFRVEKLSIPFYKIEPASYPAPPAPAVDWTCYLCSKKIDKTDKNYILGDTICGPCRKEHLK